MFLVAILSSRGYIRYMLSLPSSMQPRPHLFTNLALQSSTVRQIDMKLNKFEQEEEKLPSTGDMVRKAKNEPTKVKEEAEDLMDKITDKKNELISEINRSRVSNEEKQSSTANAEDTYVNIINQIKETANEAMESCDSKVDPNYYDLLPPFIITNSSILVTLSILVRLYCNNHIRYFISTYYNTYKK